MSFARRTTFAALAVAILAVLPAAAQWQPVDRLSPDIVYRIKDEGLQRSKVMEIASYLTDVYGPRLAGSPDYKEGAEWAQKTLREWGLANVHTESFAFGRGWQNRRMFAQALTPRNYPLIAYPKAWTPGTNGLVSGDAALVFIDAESDLAMYRGKLRGKFVLATRPRDLAPRFQPQAERYTDSQLADLEKMPQRRSVPAPLGVTAASFQAQRELQTKIAKFWIDEGVAAVLEPSRGDGGGTLFVQSGGSRNPSDPPVVAQVVLATEHYNRIARTLEKKIPVTLQMDIDNQFLDADQNSFNVLAELPGTDKADEVVMLGAHFDSWHTGTSATDNAAGSAVMMEAMRILKASGIPLRRTVRLGLWGAEEEGLVGSRAYVKEHFGDTATMQLKPEQAKLSGYFNVDNGTGQIRGVYLQGNEAIGPIFTSWMEPFHNMGMKTVTIRNTGGTDHQAFDAIGIPGFQFIQDDLEYDTRTHHSNMDTYERLQPQDLMQNAVIVASFVAQAANRDQMLPRKPLPRPNPAGR
ncbi:MAG: M20/M25/M40 family metallo-hydrolase [Acidobacteria bacterium]|nr:M20/M25/M40 family metallo-hydrolase [Acidobacteriota bacterium]